MPRKHLLNSRADVAETVSTSYDSITNFQKGYWGGELPNMRKVISVEQEFFIPDSDQL